MKGYSHLDSREFKEIKGLLRHSNGMERFIARQTGRSLVTIYKIKKAKNFEEYKQQVQPKKAGFEVYFDQMFDSPLKQIDQIILDLINIRNSLWANA